MLLQPNSTTDHLCHLWYCFFNPTLQLIIYAIHDIASSTQLYSWSIIAFMIQYCFFTPTLQLIIYAIYDIASLTPSKR